jgi:hypothetical protein
MFLRAIHESPHRGMQIVVRPQGIYLSTPDIRLVPSGVLYCLARAWHSISTESPNS